MRLRPPPPPVVSATTFRGPHIVMISSLLFIPRRTRAGSPVLATPEHLWGKDWMVPEPTNEGAGAGGHAGGGGEDGAVDAPNWNARNDH